MLSKSLSSHNGMEIVASFGSQRLDNVGAKFSDFHAFNGVSCLNTDVLMYMSAV